MKQKKKKREVIFSYDKDTPGSFNYRLPNGDAIKPYRNYRQKWVVSPKGMGVVGT